MQGLMVPRLQVSKVAGRLIMHLRYRGDEKHVKAVGLQKCFLTGGNSTLWQHCRQHYEIYKERCEKDNVPLNHHAIPPQIAKTMNGKKQKRIDEMLEKGLPHPEVFTKDAIMHSVAQFVACDDQALAIADNVYFWNCLVTMRPKTISSELALTHEIGIYIHNKCIDWLAQLKKDIIVRTDTLRIRRD